MERIFGGVTAAKGFLAGTTQAGIKYKNRSDMALVYSKEPVRVAATFTTNLVKAAPVLWDMEILQSGEPIQAVVINTGIANACTGEDGKKNNFLMAEAVAKALKLDTNRVMTGSTGVIGKQLPIEKIIAGVESLSAALSDSVDAGTKAAKAIMTTDTVEKECAIEINLSGKKVILGAMSKGSGMIHPNMATMLGILTTDAAISRKMLQKAVSDAVKLSFNMISVDRDTSTNDTLIAMANGLAGNPEIIEEGADYDEFYQGLLFVLTCLAKKMAGDGEGASKLFTCQVINAKSDEIASKLAKSVITSNLTKAAVFGNDANWGRILCAMGYAGAEFVPELVDLSIKGQEEEDGPLVAGTVLMLAKNGLATDYSEETATKILSAPMVTAIVDLKSGVGRATAWGCDLTYDYVKINADYRS